MAYANGRRSVPTPAVPSQTLGDRLELMDKTEISDASLAGIYGMLAEP